MQKLNMAILTKDMYEMYDKYLGLPIDNCIIDSIRTDVYNLLEDYIRKGMLSDLDLDGLKAHSIDNNSITVALPQWVIDEVEKNLIS